MWDSMDTIILLPVKRHWNSFAHGGGRLLLGARCFLSCRALNPTTSHDFFSLFSDNLVQRMLLLICLVVGAITGLVGMILNAVTSWANPVLGEDAHVHMFVISCIIGFSLAFILMGVVTSAVDSVIVCFAEAPNEFETHHPALSRDMMEAWRLVYPEECGF